MNEVSKSKVINDLISLFIDVEDIKKSNFNTSNENFYLSTEEYNKEVVIKMLYDYFKDKILEDVYYCKIIKSTELFITLRITNGKEEANKIRSF